MIIYVYHIKKKRTSKEFVEEPELDESVLLTSPIPVIALHQAIRE